MSSKLRGPIALGAALALLAPALARADLKVGFVDQRRGILSTTQGKEAEQSLSSLAEQKQKLMEPRQKALEQKAGDLEKQRYVLSREVFEERSLEVEKEKRELEREVSAARDELALHERRLLKPILDKWERAVREIGEEKGFDVILDKSTPGVLFSKDALDITDLVVQRVNGSS
jgi:outer membrane protein